VSITVEQLMAWRARLSDAEISAREIACQNNGHSLAQTASNSPQDYCSSCLRLIGKNRQPINRPDVH
jgi:hypothetical protein